MSEEIDSDANNLCISEDVFEQFQSASVHEEDEFITLSDIVPPQPTVPDLSQELNEIPYDNEVVLGSPHNDENQGNTSQFLDISENNVFNEFRPDTSGEEYLNDLEISNSTPKQQKIMDYYERQDVSSDGLGAQNYVIEDSASIIQDSLLSTTMNNSGTAIETPSETEEASNGLRRTKRGRIPNTAKYPMTTTSNNTLGKRRPGRPKKINETRNTLEPDSTNNDNTSIVSENGGLPELPSSNAVKKGRRGSRKASLTEESAPTPIKRGRKLKVLSNEKDTSGLDENTLVESSKQDINHQTEQDLPQPPNSDENSLTLSTSKRKKPVPKRGKKKSRESTIKSEIVTPSDNNIKSDDDADDVSLSQLKQGLKEDETKPNSPQIDIMSMDDIQNNEEEKASDKLKNNSNSIASDEVQAQTQASLTGEVENEKSAVITEVIPNNIDSEDISGNTNKRSSKMPIMSDFEYNVDKVVKEATADSQTDAPDENECLLVEDTSKRRRTVKKSFVYDEGSDEDPFANVESSEDESPKRRKKGKKYYSDDEYVPVDEDRKKGGGKIRSSSSESEDELNDNDLEDEKSVRKNTFGVSPFRKGRKPKLQANANVIKPTEQQPKTIVSTIVPKPEDDDIEGCLQTTMIKIDETKPPGEAWATSNAFENFIAQKTQGTSLKIKKVSSKEITETLAPLDIPVMKQNEPKKTTEISTQTVKASTSSASSQTSAPYDIPMKLNIDLTTAQSEKACEFLTSVVKTTVELGELMSQKSDDFMKKKINTEHVTDTFKMDYCVRKSFLLFKLAKHNLLQMEEDLANQYEAFLKENKLSACREQPKKITPKAKEDSDSDCEIVEVLTNTDSKAKQEKPKFNPKTVFLNKELSIKIAKKPTVPAKPVPGKKKLEIKGRHAVWINKNVMVKKVSPKQSFLAQDSRNKKPPDTYVTEKMVSDFFEDYNRLNALFVCAPFISTDWTHVRREYACHYFVNELDAANTSRNITDAELNIDTPDENSNLIEISNVMKPKSLCALCIDAVCKSFHIRNEAQTTQKITCDVTDGTNTKGPLSLFRLCMNALRADLFNLKSQENTERTEDMVEEINDSNQCISQESSTIEEDDSDHDMSFQYDIQVLSGIKIQESVPPLTSICYKQIVKMLYEAETFPNQDKLSINNIRSFDNDNDQIQEEINMSCQSDDEDSICDSISHSENRCKSLLTLCVELIQRLQGFPKRSTVHNSISSPWYINVDGPKSLKSIAFENIKQILYPDCIEETGNPAIITEVNNDNNAIESFTINCVNTLTEEDFQNLQVPMGIRIRKQSHNSSNYSDGYNDDNDGCGLDELDFNPDHEEEDNGWASQLQVHAFRSCTPVLAAENIVAEMKQPPQVKEPSEILHHIKSEPIDYFAEENIVDTAIVKTEPIQALHELNEMIHIPDNVFTKKELIEAAHHRDGSPLAQKNSSYNVETFEQFVRANKMIQSMDETNDEIFSQSALRIRRQHEPDLDQGSDMSMSLLVPHTFEPLHLVEAKGSLMESSSDDDSDNHKKNAGKKKDKRKKKQKKETKTVTNKETSAAKDKEKVVPENELAVLTRKMREKIRQEEKKVVSSDSDSENLYMLSSKKDKGKKDKTELETKKAESPGLESLNTLSSNKDGKKNGDKVKPKNKPDLKPKADEVQCNNVDSTEMDDDSAKIDAGKSDKFSGFTAIDQNETTNYQKLMQFVYDKIIPSDNENQDISTKEHAPDNFNDTGPVINPNDPVELLECEPTMPIFDSDPKELTGPKRSKKNKNKTDIVNDKPKFSDRDGWHCYTIDPKETKLYKTAQIVLEKLPETFVQTYMQYQDVVNKDLEDQEVDRLINLQSLNRSISINSKDGKAKSQTKVASKESSTSGQNSANISRAPSPTYSDNLDELAPSDDEAPAIEDEIPPPMPARSSENNLAKNLLMDDHDSDSDGAGGKKIKQELKDPQHKIEKPKKPGPMSKTIGNKVESESLMLTADKMMNKELNLLHAPVSMQEHAIDTKVKETSPKEETKSKRNSTKHSKEPVKNEDDSSSEEEKQWVSTKEKLLKRMGKKENAVADDAKRAKLVNEFIERRNESDRKSKRESCLVRKGCRRRKALERLKQLRFLSNELYNEGDGVVGGKRGAAAGLFKGRRNIRKVIDKKSLARSTVRANMEEFERKRRLNMRQNKLREVLGCEEGVNVLVINDEVCLEYDFEEQRPVVAVHQFFTKVMKAHQYEGVKFMWDACFESLGRIESGHGGGGCILAHCMGLGKTLQVLALLHTVLTHPRANMHRVLVCCPLSTVLNWVDEIHKWIGPVTNDIKVFELSKLKKTYERAYQLEDWYNGGGIFIIGYELFRSLTTLDPEIDDIRPTIINKIRSALIDPGPDIVVCDEGHLLKNDCSVLAVAMSRVVTKRRIILTGTPMQNNLREYFCMVNFIKPNLLGTYSEYSNRFENPIMNGQHRDSVVEDIKLMKARTHILHKVLEGCLQRQEASVLYPYLPKKHEYTVFIPLTQCQWDLYNHYINNYSKTSKQSVLRDFHILQKIWSHPQVLHSFQMKARDKKDKIKAEKLEDDLALADIEADIKPTETEVWWLQYLGEGAMLDSLDSSNKFVAVFRILHECITLGDKVLIFSTSLFTLDALEFFLKKINNWSLGQEYYRLDGSVPAEVRQKWVREFNAENNIKTKLFLISTRAGCLGLNMTAANRVIILDTSWNPAHDIQSIFRVYRFGQKKDCYIYRLVALGTMEQKIYERSVTKQAVACRVVDEQQIDRHYNLAELTELYSVDELGLTVAGGVAVGVNDVALLRVARDAAIHAVHEHDSLLRGSGEQGLPEHERAAAWNQFQQEHEHKQMQNELHANKAVVALKRLEMEHLRKQALYSATTDLPPAVDIVKTEPPVDFPLLVPKEEEPALIKTKGKRGRKPKTHLGVQCRIPIASSDPRPGPSSQSDPANQHELVQKITTLLIKHNFMHNKSGPRQISELVAKVKRMVATRQPIALGPGYDELSSSIAEVLLHGDVSMPPLTDVDQEPKRPEKPKKQVEPEPLPEVTDGRKRRKAALTAEMQFESQQDIIDLDDDGDDWQNDEGIVEPVFEPAPDKEKTNKVKEKPQELDSSIVLSDDDAAPEAPEVIETIPTIPTIPEDTEDTEVVPLHPSLLTNSNFIKIVAHTYLAGNPMMDEDAATLAAQYSTLKTLKEAESEGKPIESGAVYDIAIKVLGKDVLRKLQAANPKTSEKSASTSLQSLLTEKTSPKTQIKAEPPAPTAAVKKPRIGPKSKISKEVQQPMVPQLEITMKNNPGKPIPIKQVVSGASARFSAPTPEESILPDEEIVIPAPAVEATAHDRKPIILRRVKMERRSMVVEPAPATPVSWGRGPAPEPRVPPAPAPAPADATICLDSDEESPAPPPPPPLPRRRIIQMPTMSVSRPAVAPVPVALTGPNARPIPLSAPHSTPRFYQLSACGTHAIPLSGLQPVPVSLLGPGTGPRPMTMSHGGEQILQPQAGPPRIQPQAGPPRTQPQVGPPRMQPRACPPGTQPVPVSLIGPDSRPIPISLSGPCAQSGKPQDAKEPEPVHEKPVDSRSRTVAFVGGQGPLTLRFSLSQQARSSRVSPAPPSPAPPVPAPAPPASVPPASTAPAPPPRTHTAQQKSVSVAGPKRTTARAGDSVMIAQTNNPVILNHKLGKMRSEAIIEVSSPPTPVVEPPTAGGSGSGGGRRAAQRRDSSSSSSSSSARSRSSTPDPLSIFKDVVHIQAPKIIEVPSSQKTITTNRSSVESTKATPKPGPSRPRSDPKAGKKVDASVDLTTFDAPKKTYIAKKPITTSVDLTGASVPSGKSGSSKVESKSEPKSFKTYTSKPTTKGNRDSKAPPPSTPTKLVGTSKSIILDGKSKSLKVEKKNNGTSFVNTNSKVIASGSTNKQKPVDKRPATSSSAPAPKKKKTELMTLKDFDIDDIDDIIELD